MSKKIKVNIPGFGERYCSDNTEYQIYYINNLLYYRFCKKGKVFIYHNEYGPAVEYKGDGYRYFINNKYHRLCGPSFYDGDDTVSYDVCGKFIGYTEEEFIENLANFLIPNTANFKFI